MKPPFIRRALVGSAPRATAPLQGFRVLFCLAVVNGHVHAMASFMLDASMTYGDLAPSPSAFDTLWLLAAGIGAWNAVDIFLLLSGFFCAESLARAAGDDGRNSSRIPRPSMYIALRHIVGRWLRLTPLLALTSVPGILLGDSKRITWHELFFLSNWFHAWNRPLYPVQSLLIATWSLFVDFQAHVLIAILIALIPCWKVARNVLCMSAIFGALYRAVTWVAAGSPGWIEANTVHLLWSDTHVAEYARRTGMTPGAFDTQSPATVTERETFMSYAQWYSASRNRIGPALLGAALWIAMRSNSPICRRIRRAPSVSLCSAAALSLLPILHVATILPYQFPSFSAWTRAFLVGASRLACSAAVAVVAVLTCSVGPGDGTKRGRVANALRAILASRVFVCTSRLSYAVYLSHWLLAPCLSGMWPVLDKNNYTLALVQLNGLKLCLVSAVVSIPLCMFEEGMLEVRGSFLRGFLPVPKEPLAEKNDSST